MVAALRIAAVVAALAFPASAHALPPGSETDSSGDVAATLSWTGGPHGPTHSTLTITRAGAVAFSQPIDDVLCARCRIEKGGNQDVFDLDGDGEPEVMITTVTPDRLCCRLMAIYGRRADGSYGSARQNWGDAGFDISDLDGNGVFEIISRDTAFLDVFESGELSFSPARVVDYGLHNGEPALFDVTRDFPAEIRENASHARFVARRLRSHARGYLAAYVADEYLLGHGATGLRELDREIRQGSVGSPRSARAYRKRLLGFLHRLGYR